MSRTLLSTVLATTFLYASSSAMAGQIDGAVNADNRFTVAITQNGNVLSKYDSPSNYTWKNTQRFSLNTPENLKQCRVNVIVWGDNRTREGFAGVLKGNYGNIYSGGTGTNGFASATESVSTSGGFGSLPSDPEIITMATPIGAAPAVISSPVWGAASGYYQGSDFETGSVPTDMAWVKPQNTGNTTDKHWVFSSPCSDIVNPAVDMPGEHFQCYSVQKGDRLKPETIMIKDQFGQSKAVLGRPRILCNPSQKTHNDKTYKIRDERRHLVCYDYVEKPRVKNHKLLINNQFAPDEIEVSSRNQMFCVPSSKEHLDKETKPNGGFDRPAPRSIDKLRQRR